MSEPLLRKHYALPGEHGAWIWLAGPFALGVALGPALSLDLLLLGGAGLTAFLLRQPISIVVKVMSGRRHRRQLRPALIWSAGYALATIALLVLIWARGHNRILWLAIPGLPVFGWHLLLVRRRQERDRPGVEIVASGVLALMAPAAYWVSGGRSGSLPWLLWGIAWFHSAGSIVGVHLRLAQRRLDRTPPLGDRLRMAFRSLAYHGFNLAAALVLARQIGLPRLLVLGFGLTLVDAVDCTLRPAVGARPSSIGRRQLLVSVGFYSLAILALVDWTPAR